LQPVPLYIENISRLRMANRIKKLAVILAKKGRFSNNRFVMEFERKGSRLAVPRANG